jgi:hypothetical protein
MLRAETGRGQETSILVLALLSVNHVVLNVLQGLNILI